MSNFMDVIGRKKVAGKFVSQHKKHKPRVSAKKTKVRHPEGKKHEAGKED